MENECPQCYENEVKDTEYTCPACAESFCSEECLDVHQQQIDRDE